MPSTFVGDILTLERGGLTLNPSPPAPKRGDCLIETLEGNKMPGLSVLGDPTDKASRGTTPAKGQAAPPPNQLSLLPQQHPDLRWVFWTNGLSGQTSGSHGLHDQVATYKCLLPLKASCSPPALWNILESNLS